MSGRLSHLRRAPRLALAGLVAVLVLAGGAVAFFASSGAGTGTVALGSILAPTNVTVQQTGANMAIGWSAATLSSGGSVQGYLVKRSDGTLVCGSPTLVTELACTDANVPSGAYTYTVTAVYRSWSASAMSGSITVLTTPTLGSAPENPTASTSASFAFSGGGGSGYQCQLDGASFAACTSPKSYSGLSDGSHTFKVHAVQGASTGPDATYTWTVDTTAPVVTLTTVNGNAVSFPFTTSQTVTSIGGSCGTATGDKATVSWSVSGTAAESGSAACSAGVWSATLPTTLVSTGSYTVAATQTDWVGNTGSSANKTITIATATVSQTAAGSYTLTVAAHVRSVSFTLKGAGGGGGGNTGAAGGAGGNISGTIGLPDSATQTQFIVVVGGGGGAGENNKGGPGGTSGSGCALGGVGGAGTANAKGGGGGGGATCMYVKGAPASVVLVVGGGGGGGGGTGAGLGGIGGGGPTANPGTNTAAGGGSGSGGDTGGGGGTATTTGSFPFGINLIGGLPGSGDTPGGGGTCSGGTCTAGGAGGTGGSGGNAGGGGGGGLASGGGGGGSNGNATNLGGGGGGGAAYTGGASGYPVSGITAANGGGSAGGAAKTAGTAASVSFTGVGLSLG